jgi:hypothetical protein
MQDFLFRELANGTVGLHRLDRFEPLDAGLDGLEVGQHAAKPAMIDIEHIAALGLFPDNRLGLTLGADKQHGAAVGDLLCDENRRLCRTCAWSDPD